jgi:hypothetical protein
MLSVDLNTVLMPNSSLDLLGPRSMQRPLTVMSRSENLEQRHALCTI